MPILHWLTREQDLHASGRAPYRLLEHVESYGDKEAQNMLIQGDNLDALKALLPYYTGKVKCIYIDPPYNTKSAFEHYDDNLEHSVWLAMMYPRLELLRELLHEEGSIWVSCDDNEGHYLKVIMDEVFGRKNFLSTVIWHKKYSISNDHKTIAPTHDFIMAFSKSDAWKRNLLERSEKNDKQYKYSDEKGVFRPDNYTCNKSSDERPNLYYAIIHPKTGQEVWPKKTAVWRYAYEEHLRHVSEGYIFWGKDDNAKVPSFKRYKHLLRNQGIVPQSMWPYEEVHHTDGARKEVRLVLESESLQDDFLTPKPERLIQRILHIATNPGDIVLDSFLGSGTTAAVAHKMGRQYIGIEIGEHAVTHCIPRLQKVLEGEPGGISALTNWQGGGGFRFYKLGSPIFEEDGSIYKNITFVQLAAHVWFCETGVPMQGIPTTPFLGEHEGKAYYLLYNGILKDKKANGGNVLTKKTLESLPPYDGEKVIYGERSLYSADKLKVMRITFKQTPYDIKGR